MSDAYVRARAIRALGAVALLGVATFAVVCTAVQFLRNDYNWLGVPLSFYVIGPYGGAVQASYFALAPALAALGAGWSLALGRKIENAVPLVLFVLSAIALGITAVEITDMPGGPHTLHGHIHVLAAVATFLSVTVAKLLQSWRLRGDARWRVRFLSAFPLAIVAFVALWADALIKAIPRGLGEKVVIALILLWLWRAAWWLVRAVPGALHSEIGPAYSPAPLPELSCPAMVFAETAREPAMHTLKKLLSRNKGFIAFLFCMVIFRSAVADWNRVPTGSMQPTIRIGDRILVDKLAYDVRLPFTDISLVHLADPKRGDIVLIDSHAADEVLVKRVIGLPGDQVALRDNVLYVNGRAAQYSPGAATGIRDDAQDPARYEIEQYGPMRHAIRLSLWRPSDRRDFGPVTIPPGEYLMLGDNRDNSEDSRYLGFFPRREIIGRTDYVAMSFDPGNDYLPRMDRFGKALR